MEPLQNIQSLFEKWVAGTTTPQEESELAGLVDDHADEELLPLLDSIIAGLASTQRQRPQYREDLLQTLLEKTRQAPEDPSESAETPEPSTPPKTIPLRPSRRIWWAAAAAVFLLVAGSYLYINQAPPKTAPPTAETAPFTGHDLPAPAGNRATITLASGQKIFLDSAANGQLATQAGARIVKAGDGKLAYHLDIHTKEIVYNTLYNPPGSRAIDITLSDGTRAWLNAGSSIKYPVVFAAHTREIEMNGEAYFEVAPDASRPFSVKKGATEVRVLGTAFNIGAYDDDPVLKITLLSGSVKVNCDRASGLLHPGEQARIEIANLVGGESGLSIHKNVDLEQVMAWKNGLFNFDNADIHEILRQAARWFDLKIIYQGQVTDDLYKGTISRRATLSQVLQILELNKVKFSLQDKQLTVL